MTEDIEFELGNIAHGVSGLLDGIDRMTQLLEVISDGLFNLNLHIGAGVTPWLPDHQLGGVSEVVRGPTSGRIKWYNAEKGFGFISPHGGGEDIFVHYTAIHAEGYKVLDEGQRVEFDIVPGPEGPMAENVQFRS